jgi:AcrR family transcriptional regulator
MPGKRNPDLTRKKILASARLVLNRKEYHECPIDEIAARAGLGKGTVYLYFKSKEELYFAVLFALIDEMQAIVETVHKGTAPAPGKVRKLLVSLTDFLADHQHIMTLLGEETRPLRGKLRPALKERWHTLVQSVGVIADDGVSREQFKRYPPQLVGMVILSLVKLAARLKAKSYPGATTVTPQAVFDILMNGIKNP